ncbi:hypothetical protein [Franconibacter daqui]|uniref:hypothetical protein n=1 Tax=Franconibacter daqui TaxID=2047724 RepID=UPI0030CF1B31
MSRKVVSILALICVIVISLAVHSQNKTRQVHLLSDEVKQVQLTNAALNEKVSQLESTNAALQRQVQDLMRNETFLDSKTDKVLPKVDRIAHAGGSLNGNTYTNSIDALNANKDKFNLFEIDLSFTSDNKLVCIHDWRRDVLSYAIGLDKDGIISFADFAKYRSTYTKWKVCSLDDLIVWLKANPGKRIVTDVKENNMAALTQIAQLYPDYISRFIPQIYDLEEYDAARKLGYKDLIFSLYKWGAFDKEVVASMKGKHLYGVATWYHRAPFLARLLGDEGIPVFAHTVNSKDIWQMLHGNYGVAEIYTDDLVN